MLCPLKFGKDVPSGCDLEACEWFIEDEEQCVVRFYSVLIRKLIDDRDEITNERVENGTET